MSIQLSSNFQLNTQLPLDARTVVFDSTARDAIPTIQRYDGLAVYLTNTQQTYQLQAGITNADWVLQGSGGISTADNGLTVTGSNVQLGGSFINATTDISLPVNTEFSIFDVANSNGLFIRNNSFGQDVQLWGSDSAGMQGGNIDVGSIVSLAYYNSTSGDSGEIQLDPTNGQMNIINTSGKGMEYSGNYSAYFATNLRSIPDVGYVQSLITGGSVNIYNTDGTLTGNRTVTAGTNSLAINTSTGGLLMQPNSFGFNTSNGTNTGSVSIGNTQALLSTDTVANTGSARVLVQNNNTSISNTNVVGGVNKIQRIALFGGTGSGFTVTDTIALTGMKYAADYSANFTSRSIPDVAYVLAHAGTGSVTSVATDATLTGGTITTTGTLGLNLSNTNTWLALQTFGTNISIGGVTATGATGTGNVVFDTSPTITGASVNGVTLTTGGSTSLFLNANGTYTAAGTGTVTSVSGTTNRITSTGGATPVIDISASYVGQSSITTLGTITTGIWNGTKIGLVYGGTNADLSATGGANQFLKQSSSGAAITVGTISSADLPNNGANPSATVGLAAVNGTATTWMRSDGAPALSQAIAPTWTGVHTFTPMARTSGSASYFTITTPADTGLTAATESKGVNYVAGTRTWADGTTTTQREYFFGAPTYNKTTTSATFTTAATVAISGAPIAGTGVTITNDYAFWVQSGQSEFDGTIYQNSAYSKFGNAVPFLALAATGMELWGNDNTTNGVQMGIGNRNSGTSAYNGFFLNNDLASDMLIDHYVFFGLNSSTYTDTTFGTAFAVANQFSIQNTDGPITFIASLNGAQGYYSWLTAGAGTGNEKMRLLNGGNLGIGTTTPTGKLTIAGGQTLAAWGVTGPNLQIVAATYTDSSTAAGATVAGPTAINSFAAPTITAANATAGSKVTYTTSATVYIASGPVAGTNTILGANSNYALYVASGNAFFGGTISATSFTSGQASGFQAGNSLPTGDFTSGGQNILNAQNNAGLLFGGAASVQMRVLMNGGSSTTLTANNSYSNVIVGSAPVTMPASGTAAWMANLVVNPIGTVTNATPRPITNSATLFVGAASSAATTNYTAYFDTGNIQVVNGNLTFGTAGNKINIATGTNASVGTATLSGGTVTVSTTAVTASSKIFLTDATTGALTNVGSVTVGTVTAGTSFVINSTNVLDTSTVNWLIIN